MSLGSRRIEVARVLSQRSYNEVSEDFSATEDLFMAPNRPADWADRQSGREIIETAEGEKVCLWSDGMQSTPKAGWVILTTGGNSDEGFTWTLYGIPPRH